MRILCRSILYVLPPSHLSAGWAVSHGCNAVLQLFTVWLVNPRDGGGAGRSTSILRRQLLEADDGGAHSPTGKHLIVCNDTLAADIEMVFLCVTLRAQSFKCYSTEVTLNRNFGQ